MGPALLLLAALPHAPLTLADAWAYAEDHAPALALADADVDAAAAAAAIAARPFTDPTLALAGTISGSDAEAEGSVDALLQLDVRWPMEAHARSRAGTLRTDAARARQARARALAWAAVADAYVDVVAADEARTLRARLWDVAVALHRAATRRAAVGDSAAVEAVFTSVDVATARAAHAAAEGAVDAARARLCAAMGANDPARCAGEVSWPTLPADPVEGSDVAVRDDVRAARVDVDAADADVDAAGWARVPAPTLGAGVSLQRSVLHGDVAGGGVIDVHDDDAFAAVALSFPLPVFSLAAGDVALRSAERSRARALLQQQETEANAELAAARAARRATTRAWQELATLAPSIDGALADLTAGYDGGQLDLALAQGGRDRLLRAALDTVVAHAASAKAGIDLTLAAGISP